MAAINTEDAAIVDFVHELLSKGDRPDPSRNTQPIFILIRDADHRLEDGAFPTFPGNAVAACDFDERDERKKVFLLNAAHRQCGLDAVDSENRGRNELSLRIWLAAMVDARAAAEQAGAMGNGVLEKLIELGDF